MPHIFDLVISVWWHTSLQCSYSYSLTFDVVIDSNCQWIYWRFSEGATPSGHAFVCGWTLQPVSEMWTEIGKLLFFHFLLSELYLAKGLLYFLFFPDMKLSAFLIDCVNDAVLVISWMRETKHLFYAGSRLHISINTHSTWLKI